MYSISLPPILLALTAYVYRFEASFGPHLALLGDLVRITLRRSKACVTNSGNAALELKQDFMYMRNLAQ